MKKLIAENLRHYRTLLGLSQDQVAKMMSVSVLAYKNAENAKTMPRDDFLNAACRALRIKMSDLAQSAEIPAATFLANKCKNKREEAERVESIRRAWRRAKDIRFMLEVVSKRTVKSDMQRLASFRKSVMRDSASPAYEVRHKLWPDGLSHLETLPSALDDIGIIVCFIPFCGRAMDGFSFETEELGCVIAVNDAPDVTCENKIMALAHELGHVLYGTMDRSHGSKRTGDYAEEDAKRFSRDFLLPREAFEHQWGSLGAFMPCSDKVMRIKNQYKVSYTLVIHRAIDAGYCDKNFYAGFRKCMKKRGYV